MDLNLHVWLAHWCVHKLYFERGPLKGSVVREFVLRDHNDSMVSDSSHLISGCSKVGGNRVVRWIESAIQVER